MRITRSLEFQTGSKEEKLPYDTPDFPYLASRAELDFYREPFVPWHWHMAQGDGEVDLSRMYVYDLK